MSNRDACRLHALALELDGEVAEQSRGAGTSSEGGIATCISPEVSFPTACCTLSQHQEGGRCSGFPQMGARIWTHYCIWWVMMDVSSLNEKSGGNVWDS